MASTAPSANPGRCLRSGVFGPPPFPRFRLARSVGAGPVGLVPSGVWGRTRSLAPYRVVSAWFSRAVDPSCREFHGVLRHRQRISRERPCAAHAVQRVASTCSLASPRSRTVGERRTRSWPPAGSGRTLGIRPPLPFRRAGVAHPQRVAGGGGGPPGSPGGPAAGLVVGACRSPVSRSGVGIWLRTLGAFVAPRVG
jgi:hypothetical protein